MANIMSIVAVVQRRRLSLLGHVLRMDQSRPPKIAKMDTTWGEKPWAPQNHLEKNCSGHLLGPGTGPSERKAQVERDGCCNILRSSRMHIYTL